MNNLKKRFLGKCGLEGVIKGILTKCINDFDKKLICEISNNSSGEDLKLKNNPLEKEAKASQLYGIGWREYREKKKKYLEKNVKFTKPKSVYKLNLLTNDQEYSGFLKEIMRKNSDLSRRIIELNIQNNMNKKVSLYDMSTQEETELISLKLSNFSNKDEMGVDEETLKISYKFQRGGENIVNCLYYTVSQILEGPFQIEKGLDKPAFLIPGGKKIIFS